MKDSAKKVKPKSLDEVWKSCKTAFFAIVDEIINKFCESSWMKASKLISHTQEIKSWHDFAVPEFQVLNMKSFYQGSLILCFDVIVAFLCIQNKVNMYL